MAAYYNENDAYAAQWLRNLISAGHIAPGDVDDRSIVDVRADDLKGYTQCHFFAGIGGWSYGLRLAGWGDDRPVWTGSCPCPPFSAAGKGQECGSCGSRRALSHPLVTAGWICLDCGDEWREDNRHLLPEFIRLIGECGPPTTFGEQVASKPGRLWVGTLQAVVETFGQAVGVADLCAAGVGAPHIRQRLWWVAKGVGHTDYAGPQIRQYGPDELNVSQRRQNAERLAGISSVSGGLADADGRDAGAEGVQRGRKYGQQSENGGCLFDDSRPSDNPWRDADWLYCRDGKWRSVEPGTFPLAHGIPARVGRLRAYGNAIVPQVAAEFIRAYEECSELKGTAIP